MTLPHPCGCSELFLTGAEAALGGSKRPYSVRRPQSSSTTTPTESLISHPPSPLISQQNLESEIEEIADLSTVSECRRADEIMIRQSIQSASTRRSLLPSASAFAEYDGHQAMNAVVVGDERLIIPSELGSLDGVVGNMPTVERRPFLLRNVRWRLDVAARLGSFDIVGVGLLLPTLAVVLPTTLPTQEPQSQSLPIAIPSMRPFANRSISGGSLSRVFARGESGQSRPLRERSSSSGSRSLRTMFLREGSNSEGSLFETPSPSSADFPESVSIPTVPTIPEAPEAEEILMSVWESDTDEEEERENLRTRIRTRMGRLARERASSNQSMEIESELGPESETEPEREPEPETQAQRESWKARELQVVSGTYIPSRVFGKNIPYEIMGRKETDPTRTFSHARRLPRDYSPPTGNEILHIRQEGYEYLTLEKINGVTAIIAGTLQCLSAELAYPLFAQHDSATFFENLMFCGSMLVGNVKLLEILFRQLKNCVEKPDQQLNIIHFLMHWMQEKPEDFSWGKEIIELRDQVFRYLLANFPRTELATNLWHLTVKHEDLETSYKKFVAMQKHGWVSFNSILLTYSRPTDCDLIGVGLSNIDVDDLTQYMAVVDLILFRDGSELSTLDQFWKENARQEIFGQPSESWCPAASQRSWWSPADRAKRLVLRVEMIKHWVSLEILQLNTFNARAQMIRTFVTVASNLLGLGDLHGCHCIMQGLESPLVRLLQRSWEEIGIRCFRRFKQLKEFLYDRKIYNTSFEKAKDPVIPYYGYFMEEITMLRNEKDHSKRLKSTGTSKLHRDASLGEFGTWDTIDKKPPRPVSGDGISQLSTSVDIKKYRNLRAAVQEYRERTKVNYEFAGKISRESFILRLHLLGMNSFAALEDLEKTIGVAQRGGLNFTSRLVETRILEAWGLVPDVYIPEGYRTGETMRTIVLQKLHLATRE